LNKPKFQMALQFKEELGFDKLIEMEDLIRKHFDQEADIDGHDIGSGEMNIFIYTNFPEDLLKKILVLPELQTEISEMKAAYRKIHGNIYTCMWPTTLKSFNIL
jgi:hypothetical protein